MSLPVTAMDPALSGLSLWDYPLSICQRAWADGRLRMQFKRLMAPGLIHSSDFSGVDGNRECFRLLAAGASQLLACSVPVVQHRACDVGNLQQSVLVKMSQKADGSSSCVHANIIARLGSDARAQVQSLLPAPDAPTAQKQEAYAQVEAYLQSDPQAVSATASAECLVHQRRCPMSLSRVRQRQRRDLLCESLGVSASSADNLPGPLAINTGSNVCVSWSSVGKRSGTGHESELPFLVWRQERVALATSGGSEGSREDICFQECTRLFPVADRWAKPLEAKGLSFLLILHTPESSPVPF